MPQNPFGSDPPRLIQSPHTLETESVRSSFTISQKALDEKTWLAERMGTSQKQVIDAVCDVLESYWEQLSKEGPPKPSDQRSEGESRIRKTHVISGRAQRFLEKTCRRLDMSRDELLELGLQLTRSLCERQLAEARRRREIAARIIFDCLMDVGNAGSELHGLLGDDDPIVRQFDIVETELSVLHNGLAEDLGE